MVLLLKYFYAIYFSPSPILLRFPLFYIDNLFVLFLSLKQQPKEYRNTKIGTKIYEKKINKTKQKQKQKETKSLQITVEFVSHISLKCTAILFNELKGNSILMCY